MGITTRTDRAIAQAQRLLARPIVAAPAPPALDDLLAHIVDVHHAGARQWLDVLTSLAAAPAIAGQPHGAALPGAVALIVAILAPHLAKEERVVFPYVRRLADPVPARARFDSLAAPLRQLDDEHAGAAHAVVALRAAVARLAVHAGERDEVAIFAAATAALEDDLARHLALEDAVLFPAAQLREGAVNPTRRHPS